MSGNQIGALLAEYVLASWQKAGRLTPAHYIIKTLVTTELTRRIADAYGQTPDLPVLLTAPYFVEALGRAAAEVPVHERGAGHGELAVGIGLFGGGPQGDGGRRAAPEGGAIGDVARPTQLGKAQP